MARLPASTKGYQGMLSQHIKAGKIAGMELWATPTWVTNGHVLWSTVGDGRFVTAKNWPENVSENFKRAKIVGTKTDKQVESILPKGDLADLVVYQPTDIVIQCIEALHNGRSKTSRPYRHLRSKGQPPIFVDDLYLELTGWPLFLHTEKIKKMTDAKALFICDYANCYGPERPSSVTGAVMPVLIDKLTPEQRQVCEALDDTKKN